jgi:glycosyltransferase involved in cell wall biosynthesis
VRVLFVAPRYPHPALRGDQRRAIDLLRALSTKADVRLLAFAFAGDPPLPFDGVAVRRVAATPLGRLGANLRHPDPRLPGQVRLFLDTAMERAMAEELAGFAPDAVHLSLARMAPYLPRPGRAHRHVDLVDALSLNMDRRGAATGGPVGAALRAEARLMARYEAACVAAADSASLVSDADRVAAPGLERCAVVPNGVDTAALAYRAPDDRPPVLLFFGNLGYFPNVEPARLVAEEVLPLVRREVPEARLHLVGARPAPAVKRLGERDGVSVVGPVEDMADAIHEAAVAVLPMYSGSGMNNKVVEAMSAGTPVVTNATALRGVPGTRPGADHLRGETPAELAEACVALLRDPARREALAVQARRLVEGSFGWDARAEALLDLYQS